MSEEMYKGNKNPFEKHQSDLEHLDLSDTVVVTSGSMIKIRAVEKALQLLFPNRVFNVVGIKGESKVNEQPVEEQTEEGARNRIDDARTVFEKDSPGIGATFVSIENGLFETDHEWDDKAVAVIAFAAGESFAGVSHGVRFPRESVEETRRKEGGFAKHTVGSIMAAAGIVKDKQDPHTTLTNGVVTREQQMIDAITAALLKAARTEH